MRYLEVLWCHDLPDEPVELYSELDDAGYEIRKVEIYRDGRRDFADGEGGSGRGRDFYQSYNPNAKQYTELDRDRPYVVFAPRGR